VWIYVLCGLLAWFLLGSALAPLVCRMIQVGQSAHQPVDRRVVLRLVRQEAALGA
jgi:hypothetical protein